MNPQKLKVIFFGSSDYCIPVVESLYKNFRLLAVVTRSDKPVGRKQILTPSPVKEFALQNRIPFYTPKDKNELLKLDARPYTLDANIAVVADYGLIIPKEIFEIPKFKTINIHFSKLPDLRGASPVQYTILRGDKSAWITIQLLSEKLDEGDILKQLEFPLSGTETTQSLYNRLFQEAANILPQIIEKYIRGKIIPQPQDHSKATYTRRLTRDDGFIPWPVLQMALSGKKPSENLIKSWTLTKILPFPFSLPVPACRQARRQAGIFHFPFSIEHALRAFYPWPSLWTEVKLSNHPIIQSSNNPIKKRLKIIKAHLEPITSNLEPRTYFILDTVQLEGKTPTSWNQLLTTLEVD